MGEAVKTTMAQFWDDYYTKVLKPSGVKEGSIQYIETRRSFYAGAQSIMGVLTYISDLPDEEVGLRILEGISASMKSFVEKMMKGIV